MKRILILLLFSSAEVYGEEKVKFASHTFTLPDGYALKRVAAPPLVQRPIHMYFDVDGALYVTDSSGNTYTPPGRKRLTQ